MQETHGKLIAARKKEIADEGENYYKILVRPPPLSACFNTQGSARAFFCCNVWCFQCFSSDSDHYSSSFVYCVC